MKICLKLKKLIETKLKDIFFFFSNKENPSKMNLVVENTTISNRHDIGDVFEKTSDKLKVAESTLEMKKITDLCDDCLDVIFKHLDLVDMLNAVDSSKHFQNSLCRVYTSKYRNIRLIFDEKDKHK